MTCKMFDEKIGGAKYFPLFEHELLVQPLLGNKDSRFSERDLRLCKCGECGQLFISESMDITNKDGSRFILDSYIAVATEEEAVTVAIQYPLIMSVIRTLQRPSFFVYNHVNVGVNRQKKDSKEFTLRIESITKENYDTIPARDIFTLAQRDGIQVLDTYPAMALWVFNDDDYIQKFSNDNVSHLSAAHMILHLLNLFVNDDLHNHIDDDNKDEFIDYISQFAHGLMLRKETDRFTIYSNKVPIHERIMMHIKK